MKGIKILYNKQSPGFGGIMRKDHFRKSAVNYGFSQSDQNEKIIIDSNIWTIGSQCECFY